MPWRDRRFCFGLAGRMRKRHWLIFGGWQLAGSLVGLGAHHVDTFSWGLSGLMLLPGTLLDFYLFREGGIGNNWAQWTLFAVAAGLNTILFAAIYIAKTKKPA